MYNLYNFMTKTEQISAIVTRIQNPRPPRRLYYIHRRRLRVNKIACMYVCMYVRYRKEDSGLQKKIKTAISCKIF